MVEFEELRLRLLDSEKPIENLKEALAIDSLKAEVEVLEKESAAPDFWDDMENSQKVMQKIGSLKAKVTGYESLKSDYEDALVMIELADEEGDLSLLDDCTASVKDIETRVEDMTLSTLLSGEFDGKNALLTFHAGAGGTEAQDWAEMLFRMYNRWGERHGYKVSTLDYLDGDVAGIKSATILVEGENAYGYLKGEMGIHRLVRVSPFDSSGRRHTSFASVEVMPEIDDDVNVEIREEDIKMDDGLFEVLFIRDLKNALELQEVLNALLTKHLDATKMFRCSSRHLHIVCDDEVQWTLDGEDGGSWDEVDLFNHQQVLPIICGDEALEDISSQMVGEPE